MPSQLGSFYEHIFKNWPGCRGRVVVFLWFFSKFLPRSFHYILVSESFDHHEWFGSFEILQNSFPSTFWAEMAREKIPKKSTNVVQSFHYIFHKVFRNETFCVFRYMTYPKLRSLAVLSRSNCRLLRVTWHGNSISTDKILKIPNYPYCMTFTRQLCSGILGKNRKNPTTNTGKTVRSAKKGTRSGFRVNKVCA